MFSVTAALLDFVASLTLKLGERTYERIARSGLPLPARIYVRNLAASFRDMPFIYKDLPLDVMQDFVETNLVTAESAGSGVRDNRYFERSDVFRPLVEYRYIVMLGEAGIGKTTLFRLAVQSLAHSSLVPVRIKLEPNLVPFFVPLKAVDNNAPSPILRYLFENVPYLQGTGGPKRLLRLARKRRAMLLLDAYDEIQYAGEMRYTQNEVNLLLDDRASDTSGRIVAREYFEIYEALHRCRIWLSSRKEFLALYPLHASNRAREIINLGLKHQRGQLVKKIFDRYRERGGDFYKDKLDEEDFMQQLSKYSDSALHQMSHTPLFLTVLCYTYASYLRDGSDPREMWRLGQYDLIETCLRLLISDIDRQKARGLSDLKQRTLLNRRAAYEKEKYFLLQYLAAKSYTDGSPTLTRTWMCEKALDYFSTTSPSAEAETIRQGLSSTDDSANIVNQLILSDVFLRFATTSGGPLYDFPHARFRETLASDYFAIEPGYTSLFLHLSDSQFVGVISVFIERFGANDAVLDVALRRLRNATCSLDEGRFLYRVLKRRAIASHNGDPINELVETLATSPTRNLQLQLPRGLLADYLKTGTQAVARLEELVATAVKRRDPWLFSLTFSPLVVASREVAQRSLESAWNAIDAIDDYAWQILGSALLEFPETSLASILPSFWPDHRLRGDGDENFDSLVKLAVLLQSTQLKRRNVEVIAEYFEVDPAAERHIFILQKLFPARGDPSGRQQIPRKWEDAKPFYFHVWILDGAQVQES